MKTWMTPLPYGDLIINAKTYEVNKSNIDVLDNFIGTDVVVTERDSVALLVNIIKKMIIKEIQ